MNIFIKRELQKRGLEDAQQDMLCRGPFNDKSNFTPYFYDQIGEYISIAGKRFSKIKRKLTKLKETIENLNGKSDAIREKARVDINIKKDAKNSYFVKPEYPNPVIIAKIKVLDGEINNIAKAASYELKKINTKGTKNENTARNIILNYNIAFEEGLNYRLERLQIYWSSFFREYVKLKKETDIINGNIPTEDLMRMCCESNPAAKFEITPYVVISDTDIDMIK